MDHLCFPLVAKSCDEQWLIADGWRWMFFSGIIPAVIFLVLLLFIPETPRYLMMKGKDNQALSIIAKISGKENSIRIQDEIRETLIEKNAPWLSFGFFVPTNLKAQALGRPITRFHSVHPKL